MRKHHFGAAALANIDLIKFKADTDASTIIAVMVAYNDVERLEYIRAINKRKRKKYSIPFLRASFDRYARNMLMATLNEISELMNNRFAAGTSFRTKIDADPVLKPLLEGFFEELSHCDIAAWSNARDHFICHYAYGDQQIKACLKEISGTGSTAIWVAEEAESRSYCPVADLANEYAMGKELGAQSYAKSQGQIASVDRHALKLSRSFRKFAVALARNTATTYGV